MKQREKAAAYVSALKNRTGHYPPRNSRAKQKSSFRMIYGYPTMHDARSDKRSGCRHRPIFLPLRGHRAQTEWAGSCTSVRWKVLRRCGRRRESYVSPTHGEIRRENLGHSHLRKVVSAPLGPSLDAYRCMQTVRTQTSDLRLAHVRRSQTGEMGICALGESRVGFSLGSPPWILTVVRRRSRPRK